VHLTRCIDSTPLMVPAHARESLALLRMREVQQTFGWMVLHDLNIQADDNENILEEVQEKDDLDVLRSLGIGADSRRQRRPKKRPGDGPSIAYPLGSMPTWTELVKAIQEKPWDIMRDWSYNSIWVESTIAARLFVQFSQQMWLSSHPAWTSGQGNTSFLTLQEAMESWTVAYIHNELSGVMFLPCNAKLRGAPRGRPEKSFSDRVGMYFPDDNKPPDSSPWGRFWDVPGYIGEYHHILHKMEDEGDVENLNANLRELFRHIQCLPNSQGFTASFGGRLWSRVSGTKEDRLEVVTNPLYYKIVEVGTMPRPGPRGNKKPAIRSKKAFMSALLKQEGLEEMRVGMVLAEERKKRRSENARKSAKSKAHRVPPTRKQLNQKKHIQEVEDKWKESEKRGSKSLSKRKKMEQSESEDEQTVSEPSDPTSPTESSDDEDDDRDYIYEGEDEGAASDGGDYGIH
jgi:hypothetical protein